MMKCVSTPHGDIALVQPPIDLLQAVRRFMPFGAARYIPSREGADFGIVMQCGDREVMALTQQSPELEDRYGVVAYQANSILIAHALTGYVKRGFSGLLMPSSYMRKLQNGKTESGIGYFGAPSPDGSECLDRPFDPAFDNEFGHGFTLMVGSFIGCLQESSKALDIALFPCKGFNSFPRLELGVLGFGFMVVGRSILCLKTKIIADDPVWMAFLASGVSEVYHLPSIPAGISESDLAITKDALNQPSALTSMSADRVWPDKLFPLSGCRLLQHDVTDIVYEMEIRALAKSISDQVPDPNSAKSWYDFLDKNNLSPSDRIACLQRAVLLEPRYPGWWYSLGCSYELEGKDWYGATNAFNHVIFLHPKSGNAWFSLSQLWASRGVMSKAQECRAQFDKLSGEKSP
jgi:hypothetical protein